MTALFNRLSRFFLVLLMVLGVVVSAFSQADHEAESSEDLNVSDLIIHHVLDDHVWHFADGAVLNLPIIVYSAEKGLDAFSSANFYDANHNPVPYRGYVLDHNKIYLEGTDKKVLDLSITKNVAMLFITAVLMLLVFVSIANAYKKSRARPRGALPRLFL